MATESFFSNASLAYLASAGAGKDGKTYSIKPSDGTGDFTFSRGSNLTATRVGPTGLIEKGRENLIKYSNNFDIASTPWFINGSASVSSSTETDPFGGTDSWEVTFPNASGDSLGQPVSVSTSTIYTWSLYMKTISGTLNVKIGNINGGVYETKSVTTEWQRFEIYQFPSGTTRYPNISTAEAGSVLIFGAQLEVGLAATDYIESGASTGKAGLLENEPRFDYSGGATCPSLLLEPQRVNLVKYSEYFSAWTIQSGVTLTDNTTETLSPEGLYNATKAIGNGTDGIFTNASSSGSHTRSVYLKSVSGTINIRLSDPYAGGLAQIKSVTTEWQRFDMIGDTGTSNCGIFIDDIPASGVYIYGAQVEQGSYPTSYIPNHSGGSATRTADDCVLTSVSDLIGQTEGTLFLDFIFDSEEGTLDFRFQLSDGASASDWIFVGIANGFLRAYVRDANVVTFDTGDVSATIGTRYKIALAYATNDFAVYINGTQQTTSTSGTIPATNAVSLGNAPFDTSSDLKQRVNQALLFKERLSNADLETLTT